MAGKNFLLAVALLSVSKFSDGYVETLPANEDVPQPRPEPQVAMVCNQAGTYQNQYMASSGHWVTDRADTKGCLENKEAILDLCKKMYPKLEITNIVESTHSYLVDGWCKVGDDRCKESYWVKPYRCLEGKFQSDALLVPEPCEFDHIHNGSWCWDFDQWNKTADKACRERGMSLKNFAILLPCGIDIFTGVEFVCCPKEDQATKPRRIEKNYPPQLTSEINIDAEEITVEPETELEETTRDPYFTRFDPRVERSAFKAALRRLESSQRRKIKRIMQKWTELEGQYQQMKATSTVSADSYKVRMTAEFQRLVSQVKDQGAARKRQLVALHQQRIVERNNERKKEARACYVKALDESPPLTSAVHKCLSRLVRVLYRDRHHTITHFRHLLATDAAAAGSQRSVTVQHLRDVDLMVNDSLRMLDRFPSMKLKISPELLQTVAELRRQDSTPAELAADVAMNASDEVDDLVSKAADDRAAKQRILAAEQRQREQKLANNDRARSEMRRVETSSGHTVTAFSPGTVQDEATATEAAAAASAVVAAERLVQPLMSHSQAHEHTQGEATFHVREPASYGGGGRGLYFTVALASIALTVALVAGVLTLRRRTRAPRNLGFVEVNQAAAPEEPHIAQMQVNGYENPTYRYFESK